MAQPLYLSDMTDLQTALRAEAIRCADQFYETAMRLISEQLTGMFGSKPHEIARTLPTNRRSPEEIERVLVDVVDLLKKNPEGLRLEGLRKGLGLDNKTINKALYLGLNSDQLTKTGDRRTTTYMLAPVPSRAQSDGRVVKRKGRRG